MNTKPIISASLMAAAMLALTITGASAQESQHQQHLKEEAEEVKAAPYAVQQKRQIKSLSAKDVDDLSNGRGWGLAKAAELNGMPGPVHLLEMKDKISLTAKQITAINSLFATMKATAIPLGKRLVEMERGLNIAFADRSIDEKRLTVMLNEIGAVRAKLRFVHLATHLKTPALLSTKQIDDYIRLRGDGGGDLETAKPKKH